MKFWKNKNNDQPSQEDSAKKNHWRRYIFSGLIIIFLIIGAAIYHFAQKQAQGLIKPPTQDSQAAQKAEDVPEAFTGKYISFMYSHKYALNSHDLAKEDGAIILEQAYLSESSAVSKKIGLTVRSWPSHSLEDNPDYKMREITTKRYKREDFSEGNVKGVSFVPADDSQFEKTFFVTHGDLLAIISMTAPASPTETLNQEADAIVKSLTWLK
jgi:hypothetical protein